MCKPRIFDKYRLQDVPEFQRFRDDNPGSIIDERAAALTFGRAIHWMSILSLLWPDFSDKDYYEVEVVYLVNSDPDDHLYPDAFYRQIAEVLSECWQSQLQALYSNGDFSVTIYNDPEISVVAKINRRG